MSKRTLTPLAIFSQSNLLGSEADLGSGIDFFDDRWLDWDGAGSANFRVRFLDCPTSPQTGTNLQRVRVLVRRSTLSGSNVVQAEFSLQQVGQLVVSFGTFDIATQQVFEFVFDAALLLDPLGVGLEIVINQTSGGSGNPANQASFDVGAAELIYEDGVGAQRLVRWRACDGSCCVVAPRFPLGAGTTEDPHQGSDCQHHNIGIGKQFHGCAIIENAAQQPAPGIKSLLKGLEAEDALQVFLDTCVNWPQNTIPNDNLGNCCWVWEADT